MAPWNFKTERVKTNSRTVTKNIIFVYFSACVKVVSRETRPERVNIQLSESLLHFPVSQNISKVRAIHVFAISRHACLVVFLDRTIQHKTCRQPSAQTKCRRLFTARLFLCKSFKYFHVRSVFNINLNVAIWRQWYCWEPVRPVFVLLTLVNRLSQFTTRPCSTL